MFAHAKHQSYTRNSVVEDAMRRDPDLFHRLSEDHLFHDLLVALEEAIASFRDPNSRDRENLIAAKRAGLAGVEFLEGSPGSVGGALRMNAGAMAGATFDSVASVRVMDYAGQIAEMTPAVMAVEYRCCAALKSRIALGAVFQCRPEPRAEIEARMKAYSEKRWSSQPAAPSAGCMFKNPAAIPAGRLIDELGLKGTKIGGARISLEHGNFLVNDGGATAADVLALIELLKTKAREARAIELHTEVEIVGG